MRGAQVVDGHDSGRLGQVGKPLPEGLNVLGRAILDPFGGVAYPYAPAYAYVTITEEDGLDVFTVRAVSTTDFGVFDTLVLKKSK